MCLVRLVTQYAGPKTLGSIEIVRRIGAVVWYPHLQVAVLVLILSAAGTAFSTPLGLNRVLELGRVGTSYVERYRSSEFSESLQDTLLPPPYWISPLLMAEQDPRKRLVPPKSAVVPLSKGLWGMANEDSIGASLALPAASGTIFCVSGREKRTLMEIPEGNQVIRISEKGAALGPILRGFRRESHGALVIQGEGGVFYCGEDGSLSLLTTRTDLVNAYITEGPTPRIALLFPDRSGARNTWEVSVYTTAGGLMYDGNGITSDPAPLVLLSEHGAELLVGVYNRSERTSVRISVLSIDQVPPTTRSAICLRGVYAVAPQGRYLIVYSSNRNAGTSELSLYSLIDHESARAVWTASMGGVIEAAAVASNGATAAIRVRDSETQTRLVLIDGSGQVSETGVFESNGDAPLGVLSSGYVVSGIACDPNPRFKGLPFGGPIYVYRIIVGGARE